MTVTSENSLIVSHDGDNWLALDASGQYMPLSVADEGLLPELPEGYCAGRLLLPIEQLLARPFSLSLAHPRFIDAAILGQELNERTGERQQEWWLAWRAAKKDGGVAGMVFGLPERLRQQINEDRQWQSLASVTVDAWARLEARLAAYLASPGSQDGAIAVFDADAEGLFFGLWQGAGERGADGIWRGMRRLNFGQDPDDASLAWQVRQSLLAMGWQESDPATGILGHKLFQNLELQSWQGDAPEAMADESGLLGRRQANLTLPAKASLEFRHGQWAARSGLGWIRPWRRSMMLAAAVILAWVVGSAWQIHALNSQKDQYRQEIIEAFHKGLPDETVIIDALAQLRRAAGGGANVAGSNEWLGQLNAIGRVYKQKPWLLQEISMQGGVMKISGKVSDLETLNSIRELLQQETGRDVQLADTDLSGQQVAFRMHWQ